MRPRTVPAVVLAAVLLLLPTFLLAPPAAADIGGAPGTVHALTGARIVTGPGADPFPGTIIVRDGRVDLVGSDVEIPAGARVADLSGRTIYPAWVEPYLPLSPPKDVTLGDAANTHPNPRVHPETRVLERIPLPDDRREKLRGAGYGVVHAIPAKGVFRGRTAVVSLGDGEPARHVLRADHAQAFAFEQGSWSSLSYPSSKMGAIALARQTLLDAGWNRDVRRAWERDPANVDRPEANGSWEALEPVLDREMPIFMASGSIADVPRVLGVAREFRLDPVLVAASTDLHVRMEYLGEWLDDAGADLVASLNFPDPPDWADDEDRLSVTLNSLIDWELAPGNLAQLEQAGLQFAVTAHGLDAPGDARAQLRLAIERGLSEESALAAVTTRAAALLGVEHRVGTIEPGKDANLLVATGDLFAKDTKVEAVWIEGVRHGPIDRRATESDVSGSWLLLEGASWSDTLATVSVKSGKDGLEGTLVPPAPEGEDAGEEGDEAEPPALTDVSLQRGVLSFTIPDDGRETRVTLRKDGPFLRGEASSPGNTRDVFARTSPAKAKDEPAEAVLAPSARPWPPTYDAAAAPREVLVRGATIWTASPNGVLEDADLLARNGRIVQIGSGLEAPDGAAVVDAAGMHVTPGMIDCHSHSSISGGVNECTNSSTAEVRIGDVVNDQSSAMYRELAGGLTISNLLHGSCNAIGGQNAVIKLRWGQSASDLFVEGAPGGIKFALGENVKRSNWDDAAPRDRYPNTRMGVEQFIRHRFLAAEDYRRAWDEWRSSKSGTPPRRILELDALVEILAGDRLIHCHSYRADEIVMLIRVADDFGFRIGTFQHVLEGYKVANEIARHGAGASAFADWWSYKYEVVEAIPYAGEIMWRRGVNVSFNSDSAELSRRMNLEAAKAVKYGRVPEPEALEFVTRNPAIQLGIDDRVGSLEIGKDADFVLWSGHPLSDAAVCQQTWIDGVKRFDLQDDLARRPAAMELREALLDKAEKARDASGGPAKGKKKRRRSAADVEEELFLERGVCIEMTDCCGGGR